MNFYISDFLKKILDNLFFQPHNNLFLYIHSNSFKWNSIKDHPKVSSLLYNFILQMSLRSSVSYKFGLIFKFQINKISFISIYVLPPFCQDVMQMWEWWWYWMENSNIRNRLPPPPPPSLLPQIHLLIRPFDMIQFYITHIHGIRVR